MGCVLTAGVGQAPARQAQRGAGIPDHTSALTVNKVCGSGLKAVVLAAQAINSKVTHRITTRNRPGFNASQRATNEAGVIYNIEAVMPDERGRNAILLASSGTNAGGTAA